MRFNKLALFLVCLVFVSVFSLFAEEKIEVIRVGYYPNDDLVSNIQSISNRGYGYDILKKVEEISDLRFEFVEVNANPFSALDNGLVDIIGLYFYTEERSEKYLYLKTPFNNVQVALISKDNLQIPYDDPKSIDGKTVATYHGNPANEELDAYLAENNISVQYVMGDLNNYHDADADLYMHYSSRKTYSNFVNVLNFSTRYTYFLSRYGNEDMMDELNKVFVDIVNNESGYITGLQQSYFEKSEHLFQRNLTEGELRTLRSRPLKVAYEVNHVPATFTNESGAADGALVDVMNTLSSLYDFSVEYYPYSVQTDDSLPDDIDIFISTVGSQKTISENFKSTESFYEMQMIAILPQGTVGADSSIETIWKNHPRVGMLEYLNLDSHTFLASVPHVEIIYYDTLEQLFASYEKNSIDMAVLTQSGISFVNSYLKDSVPYIYPVDFDLNFSFSIANSIAPEYLPIFNVMLDKISVEQYEKVLVDNTLTFTYKQPLVLSILDNWYFIVIGFLLIASLLKSYNSWQKRSKQDAVIAAYTTDLLTGFMTMDKFRDTVIDILVDANDDEYELISFDMDMFKSITMYFSAEKGREAILAIASTLRTVFANETVYITRKTGEHFFILRKADSKLQLEDLCYKHILPSISAVLRERFHFTMSFGNVIISDPKEKVSALIGHADAARVQGKNKHENTFITFDSKMRKDFNNKLSVTLRMEQALLDREFVVVYQPKIDFDSLKVGGAEALVRWRPKEGNQIFPDAFIPVFEENGFIFQLDMYVLEEVCRFIVTHSDNLRLPRISVNLSAASILNDALFESIQSIILKYGLEPEEIELEVTESAIIGNEDRFVSRVNEIKSLGFLISIDDFGAGVSSLNRLAAIEADVLKLDKAFFDAQESEEKMNVVVTDVINMAKQLNMVVVAEGVETLKQAKWLKSLDCNYAQGYYFEKPMERDDFIDLLSSKRTYSLETSAPNNSTGLFDVGQRNY